MRSRQASEKSESAARNSTEPGSTAPSSDGGAAETRRAADAEQHRVYIEGLAQSFSNEQIDATWATRASSRISGTLEADATLRGTAHSVECRERTCRVEIADEGSGSLNRRLPMIALGLADLLPNVAAERIDRGDGRSAMVLYMSSQAPGPGPK